MSTRAKIIVGNDDDGYRIGYVHMDGYNENGLGDILREFYNSDELANNLVNEGCMRSLSILDHPEKGRHPVLGEKMPCDPHTADTLDEALHGNHTDCNFAYHFWCENHWDVYPMIRWDLETGAVFK